MMIAGGGHEREDSEEACERAYGKRRRRPWRGVKDNLDCLEMKKASRNGQLQYNEAAYILHVGFNTVRSPRKSLMFAAELAV